MSLVDTEDYVQYHYCLLYLESLLLPDEEFQTLQNDFMEKYYTEFEDTEENKFIYTDIQKEYVSQVKILYYFKSAMHLFQPVLQY